MRVSRSALRLMPALFLSAFPLVSAAGALHRAHPDLHLSLYAQAQPAPGAAAQPQAPAQPEAPAPQPEPGKKPPANRKHLNVTVGPVRMHIPVSGKRPLPAAAPAAAATAATETPAEPATSTPANPAPTLQAAPATGERAMTTGGNTGNSPQPDGVISAINITLPTNPDLNTANWAASGFAITATAGQPGGNPNAYIKSNQPIIIKDVDALIVVTTKQHGNTVCQGRTAIGRLPANAGPVTRTWSGPEAAALLGNNCTLPPGEYELSVQFTGAEGGRDVPLSGEQSVSIRIRDTNTGASPSAEQVQTAGLKQNPGYKSIPGNSSANNAPQYRSDTIGSWSHGQAGALTTVVPQQPKPLSPSVNTDEQPLGEQAGVKGGNAGGSPEPGNPITAINISLPTNPDANLANWAASGFAITATAGQPAGGPAYIKANSPIIIKDIDAVIVLTTKQHGNTVCQGRTAIGRLPANAGAVTRTWSGSGAAALLGNNCKLPPGDYQLSVQFAANQGGKLIAISAPETRSFTLSANQNRRYQSPQGAQPQRLTPAGDSGGWASNQGAAVGTVIPQKATPSQPAVNLNEQPIGVVPTSPANTGAVKPDNPPAPPRPAVNPKPAKPAATPPPPRTKKPQSAPKN